MKKYKSKIIAAASIVIVLAFAFWYGGDAPGLHGWTPKVTENVSETQNSKILKKEITEPKKEVVDIQTKKENVTVAENKNSQNQDVNSITPDEKIIVSHKTTDNNISSGKKQVKDETSSSFNKDNQKQSTENKPTIATVAESTTEHENAPTYPEEEKQTDTLVTFSAEINTSNKDSLCEQEFTETKTSKSNQCIPESASADPTVPIEPENAVITDNMLTCTLCVRCDTILQNIDWFNKEKLDIIPKEGIILAEKTVSFYEGESVFNILVREMKRNKIHMEFKNIPIYSSSYIEAIANIYEFDCGELSGWMYKVNDYFPNYGCSRYQVKSGDKIVWVYTCDLGRDVGGHYSAGNGNEIFKKGK